MTKAQNRERLVAALKTVAEELGIEVKRREINWEEVNEKARDATPSPFDRIGAWSDPDLGVVGVEVGKYRDLPYRTHGTFALTTLPVEQLVADLLVTFDLALQIEERGYEPIYGNVGEFLWLVADQGDEGAMPMTQERVEELRRDTDIFL